MADHVPDLAHLNARDTTGRLASRAPQADIRRLQGPVGWEHIPWYTLTDAFDADFGVDEWHGHERLHPAGRADLPHLLHQRPRRRVGAANTWTYLDLTALGRQEAWEDSPEGYPQTPPYQWWKWHDAYDADASEEHLEQTARVIAARKASA